MLPCFLGFYGQEVTLSQVNDFFLLFTCFTVVTVLYISIVVAAFIYNYGIFNDRRESKYHPNNVCINILGIKDMTHDDGRPSVKVGLSLSICQLSFCCVFRTG